MLVSSAFMRRETGVVDDSMAPPRILIGDDTPGSLACGLMLEAYPPLVDVSADVLLMGRRSAELSKSWRGYVAATFSA